MNEWWRNSPVVRTLWVENFSSCHFESLYKMFKHNFILIISIVWYTRHSLDFYITAGQNYKAKYLLTRTHGELCCHQAHLCKGKKKEPRAWTMKICGSTNIIAPWSDVVLRNKIEGRMFLTGSTSLVTAGFARNNWLSWKSHSHIFNTHTERNKSLFICQEYKIWQFFYHWIRTTGLFINNNMQFITKSDLMVEFGFFKYWKDKYESTLSGT